MKQEFEVISIRKSTRDDFNGTCCSSDPLMALGGKSRHDGLGLGECRHCGALWFHDFPGEKAWHRNVVTSCDRHESCPDFKSTRCASCPRLRIETYPSRA